MMKRCLALLFVSLCITFLVGCEKVRDLTDEESRLIAEYAAELLLKYDINYVDRIDEGNERAKEIDSEATEEEITEQVEVSTIEENVTEEHEEEDNRVEDVTGTDEEEKLIGTESNIAKIAGIDGADISYREYSIMDRYPATDGEGEFIYLDASEGYKLLVLYFDVVNTTDELLQISLIDKELDYRIVCNGNIAAKPMLTILMEDLGTLEMNIEPESKQEAVLVFQVSDSMQDTLTTMDLYINYNDIDNLVKILQ